MSEINSIAQGTYTLGQTSATTYQAGPGISITQPSEGTVRISNDETVLYSGNASFNINVTESVYNFKNLEIYMQPLDVNLPAQKISIDNTITKFSINSTWNTEGNEIYTFGSYWNIYNNGLSLSSNTSGVGNVINSQGSFNYFTANQYNGTISKVVGINRISGGNA